MGTNKYRKQSREAQRQHFMWRSCLRKRRFATKAEAEQEPGCRVYRCGLCDGWHRSKSFARFARQLERQAARKRR